MDKRSTLQRREERTAYLTLIPLLLILVLLRIVPMFVAFLKSFTNWDGGFRNDFVGLANYKLLLGRSELGTMFKNNLLLLLHIPIQLVLAFIFAMYIYDRKPGWRFFRSLYYLPQVVSVVVIGTVFKAFFRFKGPINTILQSLGLDAVDFLANGDIAIWIIMLAMVWQSLGWQMLILSGGLSSMDPGVIEASKMDGAGYWSRLFKVIVPMQIRAIEYSIVVSIIWVFSGLYNFIFSITDGGPGYSTTTLDYMIYLKAFRANGQMGIACACAMILLVIVLLLVYVQRKMSDKAGDWE